MILESPDPMVRRQYRPTNCSRSYYQWCARGTLRKVHVANFAPPNSTWVSKYPLPSVLKSSLHHPNTTLATLPSHTHTHTHTIRKDEATTQKPLRALRCPSRTHHCRRRQSAPRASRGPQGQKPRDPQEQRGLGDRPQPVRALPLLRLEVQAEPQALQRVGMHPLLPRITQDSQVQCLDFGYRAYRLLPWLAHRVDAWVAMKAD
ncbi:hypothetical protein BDV95DRAFT_257355 [Massariosphaeria phaeospora]|uniref:Uncharacterized protein n=1 Tax=Massariosphaeria phaeospora TaxID=100035 RepID=A0A7C8M4C3_9PLEO|nr:hypothetical protein BDV95DRAFT_257355 [Massariosphaeria phaeospora]